MFLTLLPEDNLGTKGPVPIEINENEETSILLQLVCIEYQLDVNQISLIHNGKPIPITGTLKDYNINDGDIISVSKRAVRQRQVGIQEIPADISPEGLIQLVAENPILLEQIRNNEPNLANAIESRNIVELRKLLMVKYLAHHKKTYESQQELNRIYANPDSEENQKIIAEKIRLENINENMNLAIENLPEAFSQVNMLYINATINNYPIRAFVDSGAQTTIMSYNAAERCGLLRLIDNRFQGEARGVGTGKIVGKVHIAQIKLGESFFPISITILESNDMDFLLGLDMLKRHRCCLDLGRNVLRIEGHAGVEEIPFI